MISKDLVTHLQTKNDCLDLICDIAVDYDGYRSAEKLMELIDEMKEIAAYGFKLTEEVMFDGNE